MKHRILSVLATVLLMALLGTGAMAADRPEVSSGRQYIVGYRETAQMLSEDADGVPFDVVDGDRLQTLLAEGMVEWYEEDFQVTLFDDPGPVELLGESSGKFTENRWDLSMIQADLAYRVGCVGQEVRVGVIDSGIKADHGDLVGNVLAGYNYVAENQDTSDTLGHGTFIGGIIAALDDESGMIGIAPRAKLVPLKCFSGKTTSVSYICRAIYGAVDDFDCDVINLSLGLKEDSQALKTAVDYAAGKGVILVAAVGNYSGETLYYPAAYDSVIGVGAVDEQGRISSTSQHNSSVFLTAPGVNVSSTGISGGYVSGSGTSYAVPYVTAAVAVMKSVWGELSLPEAMDALRTSATDRGTPGYDTYYGYGVLDLQGCLKTLMQGVTCYISPVEQSGSKLTVVVYNNTDEQLRGSLVTSRQNGNVQKGLSTESLNLSAGGTMRIQVPSSQYTTRFFVWSSQDNNAVLSNTRTVPMGLLQEDTSDLIPVAIDFTDCIGQEFSLAASTAAGTVYAVQREVPENGIYEMWIPRKSVAAVPEQAEYAWDSPLTILTNGEKHTVEPHVHVYGEPTGLEREGTRYTAYVCTICGCMAETLPKVPEQPREFADVDEDAWFFSSVQYVSEKGLMRGVSETQFAPGVKLDRGMFVTILYRMAGEPETSTGTVFSDVPADAYYAQAVQWAYANGIVKGVSATEYQPTRGIQRQEIAVMACRYAAYAGCQMDARVDLSFRDAGDISDYALDAVRWAAAEGIMIGNDQGKFCPRDTATRAEAAALCMRLYQKTI